jgi:hypothetical protein
MWSGVGEHELGPLPQERALILGGYWAPVSWARQNIASAGNEAGLVSSTGSRTKAPGKL